ncbi:PilN domain-containing protein [Pantoea stewartii]|uniref:PilN domain-containing protein n=1 Tax=Pantoea stewartii TaxID=66269 RepID=UPI00197CEA43|nr:PilN domain-containing protein [Pantoea stewartii]
MVAVNLLPWRHWRWQRQRRQSLRMLAVTSGLVVLLVAGQCWRDHKALRRGQRQHVGLSHALKAAEQQVVQQQRLLKQLDEAQQRRHWLHQQSRQFHVWQQLWLALPALLPDGLWLTRLDKRETSLQLEGKAQHMQEIRAFRQRLSDVALFSQIKQGNVQRQPEGEYRFVLHIRLKEATGE